VPWNEVRLALMDFVGSTQPRPLPWQGASGRCDFHLGMDLELANQWQRELAVLFRAEQALKLAQR
jgi:hypothetical protein